MSDNKINIEAVNKSVTAALKNIETGQGGPFGAAVVKDGDIVSVGWNSVLETHDPTAHAEVNAIRKAGEVLGTHDLSGCELYATGYPCPMCLSAIIWANIDMVYHVYDVDAAAEIGFRDDDIYSFIKGELNDTNLIIEQIKVPNLENVYKKYKQNGNKMY